MDGTVFILFFGIDLAVILIFSNSKSWDQNCPLDIARHKEVGVYNIMPLFSLLLNLIIHNNLSEPINMIRTVLNPTF